MEAMLAMSRDKTRQITSPAKRHGNRKNTPNQVLNVSRAVQGASFSNGFGSTGTRLVLLKRIVTHIAGGAVSTLLPRFGPFFFSSPTRAVYSSFQTVLDEHVAAQLLLDCDTRRLAAVALLSTQHVLDAAAA
mmetsp:Transcript_61830/g.119120  ORF Transcript_61830/g.119120 Transcript_61830/m.119120 type:complete len:132 (-) Transcript_61830:29-424(-)